MIQKVLVLGAGSAGLMAALALKRKIPRLAVRVVRDPDTPVIGVGESTTPNIPLFLFDFLGLSRRDFYARVNPTWKIGIHFLWGPRRHFEFTFSKQLDERWTDLPKPHGFYCDDDFSHCNADASLMAHNKAFVRNPNGGGPGIIDGDHAFHLYNPDYVAWLEAVSRENGIEIIDGKVQQAVKGPAGISAVVLQDGRRLEADLFVDTSGFRSELLGRVYEEPFVSYAKTLYCDRAIVGSWKRSGEPIMPYTVAETMDAGWCWRIDHEHDINRGYVYCSSVISDDEARAEFLRKNPQAVTWDQPVKFRSGRYRRSWIDNVVAVGNAAGFVEPLEATALMVICVSCQTLVEFLLSASLAPTPTIRDLYNQMEAARWDELRDFLALHYRFNTLLNTPFWRQCCSDVDISAVAPLLAFYKENGPIALGRHLIGQYADNHGLHGAFGLEGFLVMLVGNKVPYDARHIATPAERAIWDRHRADYNRKAAGGLTVEESLAIVRNPGWVWASEHPTPPSGPKFA
jgi:tryptophan halogenase